jgi:hypothetical protein
MDWINLVKGPVACSCEHGNEPTGFRNMLGSSSEVERLATSMQGLACSDETVPRRLEDMEFGICYLTLF